VQTLPNRANVENQCEPQCKYSTRFQLFTSVVGNLFRTSDRFQPSISLLTGLQQNNKYLAIVNLLELVRHRGTDSVRDLGLLCRNKMLRLAGIIVVNGIRRVFLRQSFQSHLDQFSLGSALSDNYFSDRFADPCFRWRETKLQMFSRSKQFA